MSMKTMAKAPVAARPPEGSTRISPAYRASALTPFHSSKPRGTGGRANGANSNA